MHGRFASPDEFKGGPDELFDFEEEAADNPTFYADLTNPQSLNKYQYGYNNPYKFNDPTGHCPPLVVMGVIIVVACITNPDYAVAPTGRETAEEMRSYRSTGGTGALLDMLPGGRAASLTRNVSFRGTRNATTRRVATRTATSTANTVTASTTNRSTKVSKAGSRPGKDFTRRGKDIVKRRNADKNGGKTKCEECGVETTTPKRLRKGDKRDRTETNVDHIEAKAKGGSGTPENGQILCFDCNLKKRDQD